MSLNSSNPLRSNSSFSVKNIINLEFTTERVRCIMNYTRLTCWCVYNQTECVSIRNILFFTKLRILRELPLMIEVKERLYIICIILTSTWHFNGLLLNYLLVNGRTSVFKSKYSMSIASGINMCIKKRGATEYWS